jgi:hypothetical protein
MSEYTSTELLDLVAERGKRIAELEKKIEYLCRDQENYEPILVAENQRLKDALAESCEDMRNEFPARTCGLVDQYEATLKAIRELPDKWRNERGSGPTSDPMKAGMDIGIIACADELEALNASYKGEAKQDMEWEMEESLKHGGG